MQFETLTYTGDGTTPRVISLNEIAGTPNLVLTKRANVSAVANFKTGSMSGSNSERFGFAVITNGITTLSAGSFTIGDHNVVNASGSSYNAVAIFNDGNGDFTIGTYTGDGSDNRQISGVGFQPEILWVKDTGATAGWWHATCMGASTDLSAGLSTSVAHAADYIQDLATPVNDGFTVGVSLNTLGVVYYYAAWKVVAGKIGSERYTGDGNDNRNITVSASGGTPEYAGIKGDSATTAEYVWRAEEGGRGHSGDDASYHVSTTNLSDAIQAFSANAVQVGTSTRANSSGVTYDLLWWITNPVVGGVAPTGHLYGPLVGCLGGPI